MIFPRIAFLVPAAFLLSCGSVSMPGSSTQSDIDELQKRVIELQRRAAVSEVELRELREEVAKLRSPQPAIRKVAPVSAPEPTENVSWQAPAESAGIEAVDLPPAAAPVRAAESPAEEVVTLPPPSSEAQALYDRGYTLYHQGRYEDAEKVFRELLSTHATNELSDNAWYWIGESRWARGDVNGALDAFRETLENFPGGNKTPDALLKMGQSLDRLGDVEGAREAYRQLIARYPATAAAVVAQEQLAGSE